MKKWLARFLVISMAAAVLVAAIIVLCGMLRPEILPRDRWWMAVFVPAAYALLVMSIHGLVQRRKKKDYFNWGWLDTHFISGVFLLIIWVCLFLASRTILALNWALSVLGSLGIFLFFSAPVLVESLIVFVWDGKRGDEESMLKRTGVSAVTLWLFFLGAAILLGFIHSLKLPLSSASYLETVKNFAAGTMFVAMLSLVFNLLLMVLASIMKKIVKGLAVVYRCAFGA